MTNHTTTATTPRPLTLRDRITTAPDFRVMVGGACPVTLRPLDLNQPGLGSYVGLLELAMELDPATNRGGVPLWWAVGQSHALRAVAIEGHSPDHVYFDVQGYMLTRTALGTGAYSAVRGLRVQVGISRAVHGRIVGSFVKHYEAALLGAVLADNLSVFATGEVERLRYAQYTSKRTRVHADRLATSLENWAYSLPETCGPDGEPLAEERRLHAHTVPAVVGIPGDLKRIPANLTPTHKATARALASAGSRAGVWSDVSEHNALLYLAAVLGMYGVEAVELRPGRFLHYVNTGETYDSTVSVMPGESRFNWGASWGDLYERHGRMRD